MSREEVNAHLLYPHMIENLDYEWVGAPLTFRARHVAFWVANFTHRNDEAGSATYEGYLNHRDLDEGEFTEYTRDLGLAAYRDLFRVANGANRALSWQGVDRSERGEIMARSQDILDLADLPEPVLFTKSGFGLTPKILMDIWHRFTPESVYFTKYAVPNRAFRFDHNERILRLSEPYHDLVQVLGEAARVRGLVMGCPAHRLRAGDDFRHPNMLADVWIRYVERVYEGNSRMEKRRAELVES